MSTTRRDLMGSVAGFLALGLLGPRTSGATGDFAVLAVSTSMEVSVENRDLLGEWRDESWRRVTWRVSRGDQPGTFLAARLRKDGSEEVYRGTLVRGKDHDVFLDLTPATATPPELSTAHLLYRLEMTRVDALSIGTPRRIRKAFDGHVAKSYHRLELLPLDPLALRDLLQANPKALPGGIVEGSGRDLLVIANPTQASEFLTNHGASSSCWMSKQDGMTIVRRRPDDDD
jgi:hypothetical protein